jgi:hypothetical protein
MAWSSRRGDRALPACVSAVLAFYAALEKKYPAGLFLFYWVESLAVTAFAIVSLVACNEWLLLHASSHSGEEVDGYYNVAVCSFYFTPFFVVLVALSMTVPFVVECVGKKTRKARQDER